MKRYVLLLALAGVLIVPEGASAFFRPWCAPPPYMPFGYGFGFGFGRYAAPFYPQFAYPPFYAPQAVPFCEVPQPARGYPTIPPAFAPRTQVPVAPTHAPIVTITPGVPPLARPEADPLVRPATSGIATPMAAPAPMTPYHSRSDGAEDRAVRHSAAARLLGFEAGPERFSLACPGLAGARSSTVDPVAGAAESTGWWERRATAAGVASGRSGRTLGRDPEHVAIQPADGCD